MDGVELVNTLNEIGARNGIGIDDLVENRLVGMKSRGVYENPAGSILSMPTANWNAFVWIAPPFISRKWRPSNTANSFMTACGSPLFVKHCRHLLMKLQRQ